MTEEKKYLTSFLKSAIELEKFNLLVIYFHKLQGRKEVMESLPDERQGVDNGLAVGILKKGGGFF